MLVRVSYTEDGVPTTFDENRNRTTRHLESEGWVEYIVAWRKDRLELYEDHVSSTTYEILLLHYNSNPDRIAYSWQGMVHWHQTVVIPGAT